MRWTFILLCVLMTGCLRMTDKESCTQITCAPEIDRVDSIAMVDGAPPENWWTLFQDEELNRWVELALANSPNLPSACERAKRANAIARQKRSWLFPQFGFNAKVNWNYFGENDFFRAFTPVFPANIPEYMLNVDYSYEFDFWGKNRNSFEASLGEAGAAEAEFAQSRLILTTGIASAYFQLQTQRKLLSLLVEERELLSDLAELTYARETFALDNRDQMLSSVEKLQIIKGHIVTAREEVETAKHLILALAGFGPEMDPPHFEETVHNFAVPLPGSLPSDLLARRPDLMAQICRLEAAAHLVGAARADFYPRVDISGFTGLDSVFLKKLFDGGSFTSSLLPAVHLPIFTAGRIRGRLAQRQAEFEEAILNYNELILRAAQEVADKMVALSSADENLQIQEKVVKTKKEQLLIAEKRVEFAIDNKLELLESKERVIEREIAKVKAQLQRSLAAIDLIRSYGGGYDA